MTSLIHHLGSCPRQVRSPHAGTLLKADLCCPDTGLSPEESERAGSTSNRDDVNTALDWVQLVAPIFFLPSMRGGMSPQTPAPTQPSGMLTCPCDVGPPSMYPAC